MTITLVLVLVGTCGALRLPATIVSHATTAQLAAPRCTAVMLAKKTASKKEVQVLLNDNIKGIGKKGELVKVKPAYAENFIISKGLGKIATSEVLADIEEQNALAAAAAVAAKEEAQALALKLEEKFGNQTEGMIVKKKAGPSGEIFGKVTSADLARLLKERVGEEVDKRVISVPAIKGLGSATAKIALHKDITVSIRLAVVEER